MAPNNKVQGRHIVYDVLEKLRYNQEVYLSKDIEGKSNYCKISITYGSTFLHCFRTEGFNINQSNKIFSYEQAQDFLSSAHDLVFLDLAICGVVKGRVTIRLRQDLPLFAYAMPRLFAGDDGKSLLGVYCDTGHESNLVLDVKSMLYLSISNPSAIKQSVSAEPEVTPGSVLARWDDNKIKQFYIYLDGLTWIYHDNYEVFGHVETGLDTVKLCKNHKKQNEVTVVDCGLQIKEDLLDILCYLTRLGPELF